MRNGTCGTDAICNDVNRAATQEAQDFMVCAYCGRTRDHVVFVIGASREPDWVLVQGTGKMACPDCCDLAQNEGREAIERHIRDYNARY